MNDAFGAELAVGDRVIVAHNDSGYIRIRMLYTTVTKLTGQACVYFDPPEDFKSWQRTHTDNSRVVKVRPEGLIHDPQ